MTESKHNSDYLKNIERIDISQNPKVSVILPTVDQSRKGNVTCLLEDLRSQSFKEIEIILIRGIRPHGRAINIGAGHAKGDYLLIVDDDSRLPYKNVIDILVKTLEEDKSIGMVGASIVVSPDANRFQKMASKEFPRFNMKIVDKITESDMACHGCCVIPRKVFEEVDGEKENIVRGLDPDLRYRLRVAGYKIVLAPNCWVYHPMPATLSNFLKTFFRNGLGSAYCLKYSPESIVDTDESLELKKFKPKKNFYYRVIRFPLRLLKSVIDLKFLRFIAYTVYASGFIYGLLRYTISRSQDILNFNFKKIENRNYLKEYFYGYHWDPSKAIQRAIEAQHISPLRLEEPILDLGCGDGIFTSVCMAGSRVIGLDLKLRNIKKAKSNKTYSGLIVCDAKRLAFKDTSFNSLLINSFFEHIDEADLNEILREANRILCKNGKAAVTICGESFGSSDPIIMMLKKLKLNKLSRFWQRYMNKRLALFTLKSYSFWDKLFKEANFMIKQSCNYLSSEVEKKLFLLTEFQYLGISRFNLGSIVRALSKTLTFFGTNLHRKLTAAIFYKIFRDNCSDDSNKGSCLFFELQKIN